MKRHYYAIYDRFQVCAKEAGNGFANMTDAIAFDSKKKRDEFVAEISEHDYSCQAITRREAMEFIDWLPCSNDKKGLQLNSLNGTDYLTLKYYP